MRPLAKQLGEFLRRRREELDLTLSQVHIKSKGAVNSSTLSKIENGKRNAGPEILAALAPVLKLDVQELYRIAYGLPTDTEAVVEPIDHDDAMAAFDRATKRLRLSPTLRKALREIVTNAPKE